MAGTTAGDRSDHQVDSIRDLEATKAGYTPTIVQISDIHGYIDDTRSALRAVSEVEDFSPIVETDTDGTLHWAGGEEFVLVVNGDVIDRGPANEECLELISLAM